MSTAELVTRIASELALFSGVGFLLFALNDLGVDLIYFGRRMWRSATVYRKFPRAFGETFAKGSGEQRFIALFVPAWDESAVIGQMLKSALSRIDYSDYRIFVGHYRNDPLTAAAITAVADPRIEPVLLDTDGPTTKADCLNYLYDALVAHEVAARRPAAAVVLHDAEDVIHPLELPLFNRLIDKVALVQLPVLPLTDRGSPWIRRPLLQRVRRSAHQGAGRSRSGRRGHSPGRGRLCDRPGGARPDRRAPRGAPVRRRQHDRGL